MGSSSSRDPDHCHIWATPSRTASAPRRLDTDRIEERAAPGSALKHLRVWRRKKKERRRRKRRRSASIRRCQDDVTNHLSCSLLGGNICDTGFFLFAFLFSPHHHHRWRSSELLGIRVSYVMSLFRDRVRLPVPWSPSLKRRQPRAEEAALTRRRDRGG